MKSFVLTITSIFLLMSFISAQNVKFHDNLVKCRKEIEQCQKINNKTSKEIKTVLKADEIEKAKNNANSVENMISKIGSNLKDAERDYKKAKKDAKDWGCEKTVVLMDKETKHFDNLFKLIKKAENEIHSANKEKKLKKVQSAAKDTKSLLKEISSGMKNLLKEIETINESCT